ncbi:MAG TPA: HD domain-containing phosphohydrolase, partial [Blastocatellia bacterium]|nr:HD domain-containing phosphohydrolase [Blastocatellia bacterium]
AMAPAYYSSHGRLTLENRIDLWRHPVVGEQQLSKQGAPRQAQLMVRWHHEWWNGTGYPDGLAFEDIPIGARILRAAELYSALRSNRPYRPALSEADARLVLNSSAGIECDPYVIEAMIAFLNELQASARSTGDQTGSMTDPSGDAGEPLAGLFEQLPAEPGDSGAAHPAEIPGIQTNTPTAFEILLSRGTLAAAWDGVSRWRNWIPSRYNKKALLGFEASVLRHLEFRSVALPYCGSARLDWYLSGWGKEVHSNDPHAWAATAARVSIESGPGLNDHDTESLLQDIYVPRPRLSNPDLRRWFGETDAVWLDNLRNRIEMIPGEISRAQAILLGLRAGDYALSMSSASGELKRPLTDLFRRLASDGFARLKTSPSNKSHNLDAVEFLRARREDLLYLRVPPPSRFALQGSALRSEWRELWVRGADAPPGDVTLGLVRNAQSKDAYLDALRGLLAAAAHIRKWALGYQEVGFASVAELIDLVKEFRPVTATYSKDLSEVSGGLRNYIVVAERG